MMAVTITEPVKVGHFAYFPGQTVELEDAAARELLARDDAIRAEPGIVDWWGAPRRILDPLGTLSEQRTLGETPGARKIVSGCGFDPGCAAYRLHTAINATTPHASMFFRWADTSKYTSLRQFDGERDLALLQDAIRQADVVHCHMNYLAITNSRVRTKGRIVRHYHGSMPDGSSLVEQRLDDAWGAIQVGARLSHLTQSPRMHWLPIPMPVGQYAQLRAKTEENRYDRRSYRVAHSPTNRGYKGTNAFLDVCERLKRKGVRITPVLIEHLSHGDALRLKASCDAVFDSFWLGIQGSGLEGAAMGMPVVAGDATVAALYREHVGELPYTFAGDEAQLETQLAALTTNPMYALAEAARAHAYVWHYHDYAAVGRRYTEIVERAA